MELARFDEQSYQLELQAYQTILLELKYKPLSFLSMQIGTNGKIIVTPSVVWLVIKLVSPLRGGTRLKIIPLHVQTFIIHVLVTIVFSQPMEGNERFDKEQIEHANPSFTILDNRLESLEFISTNVL